MKKNTPHPRQPLHEAFINSFNELDDETRNKTGKIAQKLFRGMTVFGCKDHSIIPTLAKQHLDIMAPEFNERENKIAYYTTLVMVERNSEFNLGFHIVLDLQLPTSVASL